MSAPSQIDYLEGHIDSLKSEINDNERRIREVLRIRINVAWLHGFIYGAAVCYVIHLIAELLGEVQP